jgi:hypothetical protein
MSPGRGWADPTPAASVPAAAATNGDDGSGRPDSKGAQHGGDNGASDTRAHEHAGDSGGHDEKGDRRDDDSGQYSAAGHEHDKGHATHPVAHGSASRAWPKDHQRNGTGASAKAMAKVRLTPNKDRFATGLSVPGNAVARHTAVKTGMGGPATADPKKHELVIIGGTAMAHGRRS